MDIDVVVPVRRQQSIGPLLYSFSRNTTEPELVTLVTNELAASQLQSYGLNVRLLRFRSDVYAIGDRDVALRRNIGLWASRASHVITFDDDQLAPPDLIEASRRLLVTRPYYWGHHRFLDFTRWSVDEILRLPPGAGRPRESPPNAWHSWKSAYGGLFGAERALVLQVGGYDMLFSGRHGGEDQHLGRRLAALVEGGERIFVHEPPFAWHPEHKATWDAPTYSNLCTGDHRLVVASEDGLHHCACCPFSWAPDDRLSADRVGQRFQAERVATVVERVPASGPMSSLARLAGRISMRTIDELSESLQQPFQEYTCYVSAPDMAISVRTGAFIWALCETLTPSSVLDLGSGFSSFVLRTYAALRGGLLIWSIDDDPEWLARTRQFLVARGLSTDGLALWPEVGSRAPGSFDLVFHDLGSMARRLQTLPEALAWCRDGGIVVLDDMHKEEYAPGADRILRQGGWSWRAVRPHTLDQFGRFCGVALRE